MAKFSGSPIKVELMEGKLEALFEYARHSDQAFPKTRTALAAALNKAGPAGAGRLDGSRITKVAAAGNGNRRFSDEVHACLLAAFGIKWPCPTYYDPEHRLDRDLGQFRRMLAVLKGAPVLVRERVNESEFPLEDMYVMEIRETAEGSCYSADIVAKPSTFPIVGDEGPLLGVFIGSAGFSQVSIRAVIPQDAKIWSKRPDEWGPHSTYEVRERCTGPLFLWQVRTLPGGKLYLDDNIDVCRIYVAKLSDSDRLVITTSAPLPELKLHTDEKLIEPDRQLRFQRIAQNQILEKYRDGQGPVDGRKDILRLGQVVLRIQVSHDDEK